MSFLTESSIGQICYRDWLNKKIFGHVKQIKDLHWSKNLDEFMVITNNFADFRCFITTKIGITWLESKQGIIYQKWQNGE
jgi:hypothetical protein